MATKHRIAFVFLSFMLWVNLATAQTDFEQLISPGGDTVRIEAIPLSQISSKLESSYSQLKDIRKHHQDDLKIEEFDSVFATKARFLELKRKSFEDNQQSYNSRDINNGLTEWNTYEKLLVEWRELINKQLLIIEKDLFAVSVTKKQWELTLKEAKKAKAPPSVITNTSKILGKIKEDHRSLTKLQNEMLKRQSQISNLSLLINEVITSLNELKKDIESDYFALDAPPIWQIADSTLSPTIIIEHFINSGRESVRGIQLFFNSYRETFYLHLLLFILIWLAFFFLKKQSVVQSEDENESRIELAQSAIANHGLSALVISLFLSIWLYPDLNSAISDIIQIIYIIIAIIFFPAYLGKKIRVILYMILGLFLLDQIQIYFPPEMLFSRLVLFAKDILAGWLLFKILRKDEAISLELEKNKMRIVGKILYTFYIFLAVSIISNILGSLSLAILLSNAVSNGIINLIIIMLVVIMLNRSVIVLLRSKFIRKSNYISNNWQQAEKRLTATVFIIALFLWLKSIANYLNLYDPFTEWLTELGQTSWEVGNNTTIEFSGIIDFFIVIILTFIVYQIIKTLLEVELFPRVKLPRGVPGAISMIVGYVIVAYGIFLALAAAGVDLSKFGLMAGALGVGIGFGLQNIVANFIAGLILAFERPIQVGDTIEAGTVMGDVKHIGVRATTIRTFDGSEVMVPNGNMIANDVINWTLSDRKKRRDIFVSVAYGSNPHEVLKVIKKVGEENPNVLQVPAPWALFEGFGDSSLNFRLRIWTAMDVGLTTKSEVAMGIYDALNDAGIEIPFPQHDLHFKSIDSEIQDIIINKPSKNKKEN